MRIKLHLDLRAISVMLLLSLFSICGECMAGNKFKLVKSVTELKDGDIVIVAKAKNDVQSISTALSVNLTQTIEKTPTIPGVEIEIEDGIATVTDAIDRLKLEKASGDYYYLYSCGQKRYICNNSKKSYCMAFRGKSDSDFKNSAAFTISINQSSYNANLLYPKKGEFNQSSLLFSHMPDFPPGYFKCNDPGSKNNNYDNKYYSIQLYKLIEDEVALNDENDNTTTIVTNAGSSVNVTLSRTLVAGKWNTFCVPFDIALSDGKLGGVGATVMEYADVLGNVMMFTEASKIEAGKAYLVKPEAEISNPRFEGVNVVDKTPIVDGTEGNYTFRGVYSPKFFGSEESRMALIVSDDASLSHPLANSKMRGMRAYFTTPADTEVTGDATPKLMIDGQITGMSDVVLDTSADDSAYGLDGVLMNSGKSSQKGIYIKNGKKYLTR